MAENSRIEYNWVRGVESLQGDQPGGYHPISIGDVLNDRYQIADKLGPGGYSTVWLALDTHLKRYVAVKVNTAHSLPRETQVLKALSAPSPLIPPSHPVRSLLPVVLDEFEVQGPNGRHACYTVTPAQGNLRDISFSRLFPLEAVAYTHSQGYGHGDIHLDNILIKLPSSFYDLSIKELYEKYGKPETILVTWCDGQPLPANVPAEAVVPLWLGTYADQLSLSDAHLLLSDFGEAFSAASKDRLGQDCHTPPAFRAPEAKFEPQTPLEYPSDVWSLATAIWEIVGMKAIFSTEVVPEDEIIAQQFDVLGPMPSEWWQRWEGRPRFYDENGQVRESHKMNQWLPLQESFEDGVQKWRRKFGHEIGENETTAFLNLIRHMLSFRPEERPTAEQVLQSEWMVKWALPDYEQSKA
ncbi:kinase-like protein [Aspergillus karnatakaensis]|uniref:kinase-like protein n=1 Tax=Aspergillus karnatakaensis TaxID=1810916 RepID=UPI003CCE40E4